MTPIPADRCIAGRDLTEPRLSPDAQWVAFVVSARGRTAINVVPSVGGPERQLSVDPPARPGRGLGGGCFDWLPDSSGIVYAATDGALCVQRIDGSPAHSVTAAEDGPAQAPAVSPDGRHVAYVVDLAAVWCAALDGSAAPAELSDGADFCCDPSWSHDGEAVAWHQWNVPAMPWDDSVAAWRRPWRDGRVCTSAGGDGEGRQQQQPRFHPDGRLLTLDDVSGWLNVSIDGESIVSEPYEHGGPTWGLGQRSYALSPDGSQVAFTRNEGGFGRLCIASVAAPGEMAHGVPRDVAKAVHGQLGWFDDWLVALRTGGRTPTQVVRYDTVTWERITLAVGALAGWEDSPALVEPELLEVEAGDGATLHARRYIAPEPNGRLLCWIHGGPTDQWQVTWMPRLAFWLSRGYSILVVDPRGSTGHGRAYTQALRGRWGELDTDDVAALVLAAHSSGVWGPERTAVLGGSSGGLTVLSLLARHPGIARCGVASYPVSDLATLAENTHRFEAHYNDTLLGTDQIGKERAVERSPINMADRFRVPLLVFHGEADPVVPLGQSTMLAERVRAAGGSVELVVYADEGHGFRDPTNQLDEYARTEAFLSRHLGA